jgi:hypothetical protein
VVFSGTPSVDRGLAVAGPAALEPICATLGRIRFPHLLSIAESVRDGHGRGFEVVSYMFPDDLDSDDPPLDGVRFFLFEDTVDVSRRAFDELMVRFLQAMAQAAEAAVDPVLKEAWWPALLIELEQAESRL